MDRWGYSLELLQKLSELWQTCKTVQLDNADIIGGTFTEEEVLLFRIGAADKVYYRLNTPSFNQGTGESSVLLTYKPQHPNNPGEYQVMAKISAVANNLNNWINLVRSYEKVSLNVDERFLGQYQKEYFDEFKIVDEDADTASFNNQQQKLLYDTLESIEEAIVELNEPGVQTDDIIKESRNLREKIQTLTKNQAISIYSKIIAKIKLKGLGFASRLGKKVVEIMLSKGLEKAAGYVYTEAPKWIEHFFPHLLK